MNKRETIADAFEGKGCLGRAAPDEPVFVLRAKDPFAAAVVRIWASLAQWHHGNVRAGEAWQVARDMEQWRLDYTAAPAAYVGPPHEIRKVD